MWILGDIGLTAWAEQHVDAGLASLLIASVLLWVIAVRAVLRQRPGGPRCSQSPEENGATDDDR